MFHNMNKHERLDVIKSFKMISDQFNKKLKTNRLQFQLKIKKHQYQKCSDAFFYQ